MSPGAIPHPVRASCRDTSAMRLDGKVILVTGAGTGVGEGMARCFADEGAAVMVHGLREDEARPVAESIRDTGGRAGWVAGDLGDPGVPEQLVARTLAVWGRLDGLVNNAAAITRAELADTSAEIFDRTIAVNLRAPFFLVRAALPQFRQQGGGRILNIGSLNAYCGETGQCIYSVSKGALMTFTRNVAHTYGVDGVRCNQLNIGWTLTPNEYALKMKEGLDAGWPARIAKTLAPSGRLLSPQDVAWAAVYFLSDEAPLVNGAVVDLEQYPLIGRNPGAQPS